ncbi:VOC family protein [Streptomyces indiaensis]|uniref:VOC domain-containing protein n=1 Tax=Streptomyces indiaensis TaxID=284033 RepID=A0ABN3D4E1_9ACTN|nr:VOC family protein [Streptomyces indiaensis]MCF1647474.1 VOC family protein [Streptomyces indiaensis]
MAGNGIAYVELYAKDKQRTAQYLVSALGFDCVADSVAPDRSSLLLRQGTASLVVTSGPATWGFLDAHGDGIADIALHCTDVTATAERAQRAGARDVGSARGNPILAGAGGMTHTLLPAGHTRTGRPGGHRWARLPQSPAPAMPAAPVARLAGVTTGVGTTDLHDCVRLYEEGFGLTPRRPRGDSAADLTPRAVELTGLQRGMTLTLAAPEPGTGLRRGTTPQPTPTRRAEQRLTFRTDDIVRAARELLHAGVEFRTPAPAEQPAGGHGRAHLVGTSAHLGDTLLIELVPHGDGPGALGGEDLQALYETVGRHGLAAR